MFKKTMLAAAGIIVLLAGTFLVWSLTPLGPMPEAEAAVQSAVEAASNDWLVFQPPNSQPETGFIFYPGGRVDYRSYAPLARAVADGGYLVIIVPMRLNLAVFSPDRAAQVIDAYPQIRRWAVGGHSLGGAMAARFARRSPDKVSGLVLLASYPAESDSLAGSQTSVISIYADQDGLASLDKIESSRALLPQDTRYVVIEGGNHAQFGWYGAQNGDGQAAISRAEQQSLTASAIISFLEGLR